MVFHKLCVFSSNLPLFFFNCSPFVTCASFQVVFICYRVLSQTYIVQFICFAIVSLALLKLALFNSICFSNCFFLFSNLHFSFAFVFLHLSFLLCLRVAFVSPIFFSLVLFFQVENILEQAQFDRTRLAGRSSPGGRQRGWNVEKSKKPGERRSSQGKPKQKSKKDARGFGSPVAKQCAGQESPHHLLWTPEVINPKNVRTKSIHLERGQTVTFHIRSCRKPMRLAACNAVEELHQTRGVSIFNPKFSWAKSVTYTQVSPRPNVLRFAPLPLQNWSQEHLPVLCCLPQPHNLPKRPPHQNWISSLGAVSSITIGVSMQWQWVTGVQTINYLRVRNSLSQPDTPQTPLNFENHIA